MRDIVLISAAFISMACTSSSTTQVMSDGATNSGAGASSAGVGGGAGTSGGPMSGGSHAAGSPTTANPSGAGGLSMGGTPAASGRSNSGGLSFAGATSATGGGSIAGATTTAGAVSTAGSTSPAGGASAVGGGYATGGTSTAGGNAGAAGNGQWPQTLELQPGPETAMDTEIVFAEGPTLGTHGAKNFGASPYLVVGCYDHNTIMRTLLRFELPASIKPGHVVSAQLVLEPYAWVLKDPVGPLSIYVHKMLKPWKQGTAPDAGAANSSTIDGATGSERYFGSSWTTIGVALDDVDASSGYVSVLSKTYDRVTPDLSMWSFDVTQYVRDWANNPSSNYGFLLKSNEYFSSATGDSYSFPQFHSAESSTASKRPKLIVTFDL